MKLHKLQVAQVGARLKGQRHPVIRAHRIGGGRKQLAHPTAGQRPHMAGGQCAFTIELHSYHSGTLSDQSGHLAVNQFQP